LFFCQIKGTESNFNELWKAYIKKVGSELSLKGKNLFHPVRLALTGRMSGPDVGDQLKLLGLATSGVINPLYKVVDLKSRIEFLRNFDLNDAIQKSSVNDGVAAV
jgi:glutamyl-tRNA synthetase